MKSTALTQIHKDLGARMAEFAGYHMPISYSTIKEEHLQVRQSVGVFDVSHMGEFIVKGKEALKLVQQVTSNDASVLEIGDAQYAYLPNESGGIIDDLIVYRLDEDQCAEGEQAFMLVVNASNIEKDFNWIKAQNHFETRLIDISDQTSLLAVQGPKAVDVVQKMTSIDLSNLKYYTHCKGTLAGIENVLISATGYTGSGGLELYIRNEFAVALWDAIFEAGRDYHISPIGLGARDTLRLEMGYCLYGNDISDETSPFEAGLGWITKMQKGEFVGKQSLQDKKAAGLKKRLVGFKVEDRRVPRQGYPILIDGTEVGVVTSGTLSPSLGIPIGMGYVPFKSRKPGTELQIMAGKKLLSARVVKLPFYQKE